MQLEIQRVYPKAREWQGDKGMPAAYVKVLFTDGSEGEYRSTPEKAQEHIDALTLLVGKPSEFEIDASKEREYQGVKQRKIVSYPGKPSSGQGGGGGGRQYTPRYTDTAEGFRAEQTAMNARTALMQSVEYMTDDPTGKEVLDKATEFFQWLQHNTFSDAPKAAEPIQTRKNGQDASQQATDAEKPDSEEHSPRKAFFALWKEKNLPKSDEYSRFVIRQILIAAKRWPADEPLKSREELGEQAWSICYAGLSTYVNKLVVAGIKPMEEAGFQREGAEA